MLGFNIILIIACIWIAMYLNYNFLRVARLNKLRFRLFSLRDDLALLAMQGVVKENEIEYKTFMRMLNDSIKIMDQFSIIDFLRFVVKIHQDNQLQDDINSILRRIDHRDARLKEIAHNYYYIIDYIFNKQLRIFKIIQRIFQFLLSPFRLFRVIAIVDEKARIMREIESEYKDKLELTGHYRVA
ncbi:MAG: hypothetical protein L7F77_04520 [Candidatus Magnetominusculus sp. LBB02]|nr:hypothetical protein [Candidatus Magnetominusculus sp. LBB02]